MNEVEENLALLGYDTRWLEYGFISASTLREQAEHYRAGTRPGTEHHRYASFQHLLANRTGLSDRDVQRYIELAHSDPDATMAGSALADLVDWPGLSRGQFEFVAKHAALQASWLQRRVERRRLLTALELGALDDKHFDDCLTCNDPVVQRALLTNPLLSVSQLVTISERGANKAIRNLARVQLEQLATRPSN